MGKHFTRHENTDLSTPWPRAATINTAHPPSAPRPRVKHGVHSRGAPAPTHARVRGSTSRQDGGCISVHAHREVLQPRRELEHNTEGISSKANTHNLQIAHGGSITPESRLNSSRRPDLLQRAAPRLPGQSRVTRTSSSCTVTASANAPCGPRELEVRRTLGGWRRRSWSGTTTTRQGGHAEEMGRAGSTRRRERHRRALPR